MPIFEEENASAGELQMIEPANVLDAQGIDMAEYLPRIDLLFDNLDTQAAGYASISDFRVVVDQAMSIEASYLEDYLSNNKSKPKTEPDRVVVTASRGSGLSILRPRGGGVIVGQLTQDLRDNIRGNLKNMFPGITDAEIDSLVAQVQRSPLALAALAFLGDIKTSVVNGVARAEMTNTQVRTISNVLRSLNTTKSMSALNRMNVAIRSGRIRVRGRR